ncbi:MAG TPA: DUF2127 domain-containing protein [Bryobacteraceae bacterium]
MLIGLFKLLKGLLLVAAGIGALRFLHKDLAASVNHWVDVLRIDPENRFIHPILAKIFAVSPKQLKELGVGTFIYAALLLTEGIGLLLRQHWAEYFTVISTGIFIPLEIYELARHFTAVKALVLLINVAIVVYLIGQLRRERRITGAPQTGRSYKSARSH